MNLSGVMLTSTLLLAASVGPATAQDGGLLGDDNADAVLSGSLSRHGRVHVVAAAPGAGDNPPSMKVSFDSEGRPVVTTDLVGVRVPDLRVAPAGDENLAGACRATMVVLAPRDQRETVQLAYRQAVANSLRAIFPDGDVTLDDVPRCVGAAEVSPPDVVSGFRDLMGDVARQLPRPDPVIYPSRAITGLDAYLMTNRALAWSDPDATITLGPYALPVALDATATFMVDWGQADDGPAADPAFGRTTGPHSVPGRSYDEDLPVVDDDTITHVYTTVPPAGPVTVAVTDLWEFHYTITIGDERVTGTITAELAPVTTDVDVIEYQAVIQN